jgi:hypothetical protein
VADSALGHLRNLCAAMRAGLRFVVPLRADSGWAARFDADVGGLDRLAALDYVAQREQRHPAQRRTVWRGLLGGWQVTDPATKSRCDLRVAYIWSSEEAASVADARQRALTKAETLLAKVRNGLGGRYYKTKAQVDTRVARIVGANIAGLLKVTIGVDTAGKPTLAWARDEAAIAAAGRLDGLYALATNLADPETGPLTALDVLRVYKDSGLLSSVIVVRRWGVWRCVGLVRSG